MNQERCPMYMPVTVANETHFKCNILCNNNISISISALDYGFHILEPMNLRQCNPKGKRMRRRKKPVNCTKYKSTVTVHSAHYSPFNIANILKRKTIHQPTEHKAHRQMSTYTEYRQ